MPLATFPDLAGASVFVTGGGSGIGAALVEGFAAQRASVTFIDKENGEALATALAARFGVRVRAVQGDVTDTEALRAAIAEAAAINGPITVLVNNVADDERHATLDVTPQFWDANQSVNLRAAFFATQTVVPGMQAAGGGQIVNLSSIAYLMGNDQYPSYATAKAALVGMTRAHAREFGPSGIRVNALLPGWTMTDKQRALWVTPESYGPWQARQCLKRELLPEDIVPPALFLASAASTMVTGQALPVDGGVVVTG